ncbi:MAG: P-loop NTPase [Chlorobi bacterium]|nr:P-loop NTPase [Chlorobiota bacterium]
MKIAIASGKGGTGKTTLSTNLAKYLSKEFEVVLTDLDVEEPNSGLFLNLDEILEEDKFKMIPKWIEDKCTLCGICQKSCNYHAVIQLGEMILVFPELCHSCYACSELCPEEALPMIKQKMGVLKQFKTDKLNFVESRLEIGQEQAVPLIKETNNFVENNFGKEVLKIYDSPPGTSCPVIEATKNADFVFLVTEPTPFGLNDLQLAVETMRELNKDFGVVVNRSDSNNKLISDYCDSQKIKIIANIPNKREIAELYSSGEEIYSKVPEFAVELKKIKSFLINELKVD